MPSESHVRTIENYEIYVYVSTENDSLVSNLNNRVVTVRAKNSTSRLAGIAVKKLIPMPTVVEWTRDRIVPIDVRMRNVISRSGGAGFCVLQYRWPRCNGKECL